MAKVLEGKVAIITGAGSGIGRASALLFASEGAALVLGDKSEAVHDTAGQVQQAGGRASALQIDAGVSGGMAGIFETTPEHYAEVLRVNLIGPWLMVKHAGQAMADAGNGGAIVCTASVAGIRSGAGGPAYSASKAGVINLVQVSAQQLCETNVRVNAICPGLTETGMTQPTFDYAKDKGVTHKLGKLNPLRRAAQPEELAQAALFLASAQSSYVNGQALVVDGGLSSSHPVTRQLTGQTAV